MKAVYSHYGAKWWKFEFHSHSPISDDYGKGPDQAVLKSKNPREWLIEHMQAGLDCIAITDHNSGEWIDKLKTELIMLDQEKPVGYRELVLFPGVEISVNGGIHLLAIFDPSIDNTKIVGLLSKCDFDGAHGQTDCCTKKSCSEVIEIIQQEGGIPVLAHADDPSGLFIEQTGVTLKQTLKSEGLLAMELVDPLYVLPQVYTELHLSLAPVIGSDSHHPSSIGKRYTWVKMESPTLDALRLALHDGEDGVKRHETVPLAPNEIGHRFCIRRVTISNGQKIGNGNALEIQFSPWLTTLIGGRGSGKSSILDFVRICLGRTEDMPPEIKKEFEDFNRVPRDRTELGMLRNDTSIRLELIKDGRDIALTWQGGNWVQDELDSNGNWIRGGFPGDIQRRFPVRIFSQKQLYEMTKHPDVLLNLIDERWGKREWIIKRENLIEEWLKIKREARQTNKEIATVAQTRAELEDTKAKIRNIEAKGYKEILLKYQAVQSTKLALETKTVSLEEATRKLGECLDNLPALEIDTTIRTEIGDESCKLLDAIINSYGKIQSELEQKRSELKDLSERWSSSILAMPWKMEFDAACKKYEDLKEQVEHSGITDIAGYSELVEQRSGLETKVQKLSEYEASLKLLQKRIGEVCQELKSHEHLLRDERCRVIAQWGQFGNGERLRVTMQEMGNLSAAEGSLRQLIRKPGEEFSKDIYTFSDSGPCSGILAELIDKTDPTNRWIKLEEIIRDLLAATSSDPKGFDRRFVRHLDQLRINTPEDLDRLEIWVPDDKLKGKS